MPSDGEKRPVSISLLALPESTPAALYGLYEVFTSAGVTWAELTGEDRSAPYFDVKIVSTQGDTFTCVTGTPIAPDATIDQTAQTDVVLVTDLAFPLDADPRGRWPNVAEWLRQRHADGALICSVCTGSVLLADAGLLDGLEATTHWSVADLFARYFPSVRLRPERILVPTGPEHRVITSGGASSWEDLAMHVVARFCGRAEAIRTAKVFLFGDRSEGQLPYMALGRPRRHDDAVIADAQAWIAEHYAMTSPVARMVDRSGLAERTFKRRFRAATGYAPVEYVQALRIEEAKQLLETSDKATDAIAFAIGYEDPTFFRRLFKRSTGTTPARYRRRYKSVGKVDAARPAASTGRG
ncbi:MAG: helix-turn-helix domain-containing protein [Alphaproteobacteria bacterium]